MVNKKTTSRCLVLMCKMGAINLERVKIKSPFLTRGKELFSETWMESIGTPSMWLRERLEHGKRLEKKLRLLTPKKRWIVCDSGDTI